MAELRKKIDMLRPVHDRYHCHACGYVRKHGSARHRGVREDGIAMIAPGLACVRCGAIALQQEPVRWRRDSAGAPIGTCPQCGLSTTPGSLYAGIPERPGASSPRGKGEGR